MCSGSVGLPGRTHTVVLRCWLGDSRAVLALGAGGVRGVRWWLAGAGLGVMWRRARSHATRRSRGPQLCAVDPGAYGSLGSGDCCNTPGERGVWCLVLASGGRFVVGCWMGWLMV